MISEARKVGYEIDRRRFLRSALIASAIAVTSDQWELNRVLAAELIRFPTPSTPGLYFPARSEILRDIRHFAPVKVSRNRIIREVVGLRPYRSEGFVVEAERFGNKLLIHNYGHGGAGVTLSWGTASLAVDLAREFMQTRPPAQAVRSARRSRTRAQHFAVLGCGVNGLATARLLQRRFQNGPGTVTIYAKDLPPETTSNIAGAFWYPSSVFDPQKVTPKFSDQFQLACQISHKAFQTLVGTEYGVRWTETYELMRDEASLSRELLGGGKLYPQTETHRDAQQYFGFPFVRQFSTMMIEPHVYLSALLRDFYIAGGKVVVKEFRSREEIGRIAEPIVFNCTGLGARALFNDERLIPVRGQLEVLLPQPEVDYCYLSGSSYMFPRRDGIILGGTWDHEDWSLEPNAEQTTEILEAHSEIMKTVVSRQYQDSGLRTQDSGFRTQDSGLRTPDSDMLIKAAINGGRTKAEHRAVPVSPDEQAAAVAECVKAGAGAIHLHVRYTSNDENFQSEGESLYAKDVAQTLLAVLHIAAKSQIGITTGAWILADPTARLEAVTAWDVLPGFASVNFGEDGAVDLARLLLSRGVDVEVGLCDADAADLFLKSGLVNQQLVGSSHMSTSRFIRVLLEPQDQTMERALESVRGIEKVLDSGTMQLPRLLHGTEATVWPMMDEAIARGYDVRVGLEDTLLMPDGRIARDNTELIKEAVRRISSGR